MGGENITVEVDETSKRTQSNDQGPNVGTDININKYGPKETDTIDKEEEEVEEEEKDETKAESEKETDEDDSPDIDEEEEEGLDEDDENEEEEEEESDEDDEIFEDFDVDDEEEDSETESSFDGLTQKLGIEGVEDVDGLKNYIEELKGRVPEYPDEKTESMVNDILEVGRAGGNVDKVAEYTNQIEDAESHIKRRERLRKNLEGLKTAEIDNKKKWLLEQFHPNMREVPESDMKVIREEYEDKSNAQILTEFHSALREVLNEVDRDIQRTKDSMSEAKSGLKDYKNNVKETRKKAQERMKSAIKEYKDPDGIDSVTRDTRKLAKSVFNSPAATVTLPKGLVNLFMTDGKLDHKKAIDVLSAAKFSSKKTDFLKSKLKQEMFREEHEYGKRNNRASDSRVNGKNDKEWDGKYRG